MPLSYKLNKLLQRLLAYARLLCNVQALSIINQSDSYGQWF